MHNPYFKHKQETACDNVVDLWYTTISVVGTVISVIITGAIILGMIWFTNVFCYPYV